MIVDLEEHLPALSSTDVKLLTKDGQELHLYRVWDIEDWHLVAHPRRMTERELAELLLEHTLPLVAELEKLEAEFEREHGFTPRSAITAPYGSQRDKSYKTWLEGRPGTLHLDALLIALKNAGFLHVDIDVATSGAGEDPRRLQSTLEESYRG